MKSSSLVQFMIAMIDLRGLAKTPRIRFDPRAIIASSYYGSRRLVRSPGRYRRSRTTEARAARPDQHAGRAPPAAARLRVARDMRPPPQRADLPRLGRL